MPEEGLTEQEKADLKQVGRKIRRIRTARNMTQDELSRLADIQSSGKGVSRFEHGDRQMKLTTFFGFAAGLSVTPNDISPDRLLSPDALQVAEFSDLNAHFQRLLKEFASTFRRLQDEGWSQDTPFPQVPRQNG